jgi:hypothetical protein
MRKDYNAAFARADGFPVRSFNNVGRPAGTGVPAPQELP